MLNYLNFSSLVKGTKQRSPFSRVWIDYLPPRMYFSRFSHISLPNFVPTLDLCPSSSIYTLVLVGKSWWGNIQSDDGSLHLWGLGGFLSLVHCSTVSCYVSERGPTFCRRGDTLVTCAWRRMPNFVSGWWIPPRHYLMSSAHMGFCWKVLSRWGPLPRMVRYTLG